MLRAIVSSGLTSKFLVIGLAAVLIVLGASQLPGAPVDVLPEFSPPYVEIQTEALGLSAEEVEQLVTVGLEQDLLNGVPWLSSIYSESLPGLSSIVLVFEPGTDVVRARQMVAERLAQAFALPHVSRPPTMLQPLSSTSRVMVVGLSSKTLTPIQMSVLARWTISPRLLGVPGVANVAIWGQRDRQLQVLVDPKRLRERKISLAQVLETTGNALWVSSLSFVEASTPGTGGFIDTSNQRVGIRHLLPIVSPDGLAQVPIESTKVTLGDVATIVEDHQPLIGDATTDEGTGLLLVIEKFPGSNALAVTRGVEAALDELKPGLAGLDMNPGVFRPADFIEVALHNLGFALSIGLILVLIVLAVLGFGWRSAVIGLLAVGLPYLVAGLVLYATGATFNVMVLAGFLIAIGIVVDDAVVDGEHITRRMAQSVKDRAPGTLARVVLEASLEMRGTMLYGVLILLLAIVPILFIGATGGPFFRPLAISYALAMLTSMLVALTVTPAACLILFSGNATGKPLLSKLVTLLQGAYASLLRRSVGRGGFLIFIAGVLTVAALAVLPILHFSILPQFKDRNIVVHLQGPAGMSQPEMSRISSRMSEELRTVPGIASVSDQVGRAIFGDRIVNVNVADLLLRIASTADYDTIVSAIDSVAGGYPGLRHGVTTYLDEESHGAAATTSGKGLTVRVYGATDVGLRASAEGIQKAIAGVSGIGGTQIDFPEYQPDLEIEVDLPAAKHYGITPGDVRRAAATMFSGIQVGSLFEEQKVFDVVVWSTPESRRSLSDILSLQVDTPNGGHIALGDVARVRITPSPGVIRHEAVKRYADVAVAVAGGSPDAVAAEIRSKLRRIQLPLEYHAEVFGDTAGTAATWTRPLFITLAAVIGIFLLLQAAYRSWRLAFCALLTFPMALSGGLLAALLGGGNVSLGTLAGLLTVLGVAIRNGIAMTEQFYHLENTEGEPFGVELVIRGARERIVPILTSALGISAAVLPGLLFGDVPGFEVWRPMAGVVLGGLVTTLILDLFVLPGMYLRFGASREPDLELVATHAA